MYGPYILKIFKIAFLFISTSFFTSENLLVYWSLDFDALDTFAKIHDF